MVSKKVCMLGGFSVGKTSLKYRREYPFPYEGVVKAAQVAEKVRKNLVATIIPNATGKNKARVGH